MKRVGFTLVELVVVLATVLLLWAILLPVFDRSHKGSAQRSSCQSNLKQVGLGFKQYQQDFDDALPRAAGGPPGSGCYGWAQCLQPYVQSTQVYQCPSEPNRQPAARLSASAGYTDYYANAGVLGRSETCIKFSANVVLLSEGNDGTDVTDARYAYFGVPAAWLSNSNSPVNRHLNGCNYAFVDGHVKWLHSSRAPGNARAMNHTFSFQP